MSFYLSIPVFILFSLAFSLVQFGISGLIGKWIFFRFGSKGVFIFPFVWLAVELLREYFPFGGFPWLFSGYAISYINPIAQMASITGIYGLSVLVLSLSAVLFYFYERRDLTSLGLVAFSFVFVIAVWLFGEHRINNFEENGKSLKVAVLQGNIPEDMKQDVSKSKEIIDIYIKLFKEASKENPDLIVLPESALPFYPRSPDRFLYKYFFEKIKDIKVPFLTGYDDIFYKNGRYYLYNAIYLYDEKHQVVDFYTKIKLVPFGEYVPFPFKVFSSLFPYLEGYDYIASKEIKPLKYKEMVIAPFICFEAIFPSLLTQYKDKGINLLVNISNDAWFGKTSAPFQHFEMARVRAIESGRYLVRSANTGISAIVNPVGRIKSVKGIFERGYITGKVKLINKNTIFMENRVAVLFLIFAVGIGMFLTFIFVEKRKIK